MQGLDAGAMEAVIERGIKQPIRLLLDSQCYQAAIVLTYSGMDTMAFLNMPGTRADVMRSDFIAWTEQYVKIESLDPPTGKDLYGTRCTVLHGGAESRFVREGRGRLIQHVSEGTSSSLTVSPTELARAFFAGVDQFVAELMKDSSRAVIANERLNKLQASGAYD